jgi:hypothetical protein
MIVMITIGIGVIHTMVDIALIIHPIHTIIK